MAEFVLSPGFLREEQDWEKGASPRDAEALEKALAAIVADPELRGRFLSHYDPAKPSFLYRAGPLLIHYRVGADGVVEFLNLYHH